jgi:hypothetical protein
MGEGLLAAVVRDPVGILLVPMIFHAPAIGFTALEFVVLGYAADPMKPAERTSGWMIAEVLVKTVCWWMASLWIILRTENCITQRGERFEQTFTRQISRLLPYTGAYLLFSIGAGISTLLCIVPVFFFLYFFAFAPLAVAIERIGVIEAFGYSRRVVRGAAGRWILAMVFLVVVCALLIFLASMVMISFHVLFPGDFSALGLVGLMIFSSLVSIVALAVWTSVFLDFRSVNRSFFYGFEEGVTAED